MIRTPAPSPEHATGGYLLTVLAICAVVVLTSCSNTHPGPEATPGGALTCRAIGAFADASHYGEHVRRPDPMEERTLARAQAIAQSALATDHHAHDGPRTGRLAATLVTAISDYRRALRDGTGFKAALEQFRVVVAQYPSGCLANRFLPTN